MTGQHWRDRHVPVLLPGALICLVLGATLTGCVTASTGDTGHNSNAANINVQLGVDYLKQGNLALAQTKLQRAEKEDSHNVDVHGAMGLLDERLGKDKDADREYRRALVLSHHSPAMLNNYAVYLCSHDRADEGVRYFEEAATNPLYQTPWAAYTNAGVCLRAVHRDNEAMQRFTRALQVNPSYAEAAYQASELDFSLQRYTPARERIDAYLMGNHATADLLLLGWRIARAQDDRPGQEVYATRLDHEFPGSPQVHALELEISRSDPR